MYKTGSISCPTITGNVGQRALNWARGAAGFAMVHLCICCHKTEHEGLGDERQFLKHAGL